MRKLGSIQVVKNILPIEGKDRIEILEILGWQVISEKGLHKVGDKIIYCEVDSILPEKPEFEFLRKRCFSQKYMGHRIKTLKLGSTISQGICFPLSIFNIKNAEVGKDVTDLIGIRKYDSEEVEGTGKNVVKKKKWFVVRWLYRYGILKGESKQSRKWPEFLVKTDETRLQAIPSILGYLKNNDPNLLPYKDIIITSKLDGSSCTMYCKKQKFGLWYFGVCSRNMEVYPQNKNFHKSLEQAGNIYWRTTYKYNLHTGLKKWCKKYNRQIAIQGEIVGEGIQGNRHRVKGIDFYVFQIYDIDKQRFLDVDVCINICRELDIKYVPIVNKEIDEEDNFQDINYWIKKSHHLIKLGEEETLAEGIVVRTVREQYISGLETIMGRVSFKVVNPEYLLKWGI